MGWYTLDKKYGEAMQLNYAVSELYDEVTVLESHRQVYTTNEKQKYSIDYDAVSHHAVKINATNKIIAITMLERIDDKHITYKPYTENDCPGEAACPRSILEKLSPTENLYAIEWRNKAYSLLEYPHDESKMVDLTITSTLSRSDPDANPLYSKDGNDFTDALIEHFESKPEKKNNNQLNNSTMEKTTVTGFVGKSFNYNYNEETKKSVISLQIKPREGDWVHIKAFNQNADLIMNSIKTQTPGKLNEKGEKIEHNSTENGEIKKLTVSGKIKEAQPYVNKKGETIQNQELVVDSVNRHKTVEINGVIAKVEDKQTSNNKPYTHLFIKNNVNVGGVEKVEQFNVTIFAENKKGIPADVEMKAGQPIAIKGEATITRYLDKENKLKESTNINAWNVDRTPTRLKEQIKNLQDNAQNKDNEATKAEGPKKEKAAKKAPATKKGKDSEMQM